MPLYRSRNKIIFFSHIPKTGGSTVEEYLIQAGAIEALKHPKRLNFSNSTPQHMHAEIRDNWVPETFVDYSFAVVRNPLARIVSEYHWRKLVSKKTIPPFDQWVKEEFSKYKENNYILDNNIRPQVGFVSQKDQVFRLEDGLEEPIKQALVQLELASTIEHLPNVKRSAAEGLSVSHDTLESILEFYSEDFTSFGYDSSSFDDILLKKNIRLKKIKPSELKSIKLRRVALRENGKICFEMTSQKKMDAFQECEFGLHMVSRNEKHSSGRCFLELLAKDDYTFSGECKSDFLALGENFSSIFDIYISYGEEKVRLKTDNIEPSESFVAGNCTVIPYKTVKNNASLQIMKASLSPERGYDVAIFLRQINYTGGKTKAMLNLASQLKDRGLEVKIILFTVNSEPPNFVLRKDIPIEVIQSFCWSQENPSEWSFSNSGFSSSGEARIRAESFLSNLGAKVAIIPDYPYPGLNKFLLDNLPRTCVKILSDHDPSRATFVANKGFLPSNSAKDQEFLRSINSYDMIHVINPLLLPAFKKATRKRVVYIPNGVARWEKPRGKNEIYSARMILALTRLKDSKRVDHLINAFSSIAYKHPNWKLLILGRGVEEENLRKLINDRGLEKQIILAGFDPDINSRFIESAFFVSAAAVENLSLAYLEAMGTGTPLLTYNGNATARYVLGEEGENGFSALDGDVGSLADAMDDLVTKIENRDPTVIEKASSAYSLTEQFDPHDIGERWAEVIIGMIKNRSKMKRGLNRVVKFIGLN